MGYEKTKPEFIAGLYNFRMQMLWCMVMCWITSILLMYSSIDKLSDWIIVPVGTLIISYIWYSTDKQIKSLRINYYMNLKNMAINIYNIPQDKFSMLSYDDKQSCTKCIIGHSMDTVPKDTVPMITNNIKDYSKWVEDYTGLPMNSEAYKYLFSSDWTLYDNSPKSASKRIIRFLDYGVPKNWKDALK